jgi:MFS family permease
MSVLTDRLLLSQFNALYSAYSFPNMVLPFFGGFLVDKLGCRTMITVFAALLVVGQSIFAFGANLNSYPVMLVGRVFYGFGGESLCVAAQTMLAEWFMGQEMAMAMGINLSVSRLGSVVNDQTSVAFYKATGLAATLWIGVILLAACFLASLVAAAVDRHVESESELPDPASADPEKAVPRRSAGSRPPTFSEAITRSFTSSSNRGSHTSGGSFRGSECGSPRLSEPLNRREACRDKNGCEEEAADEISLSDITSFSATFWMIAMGCVVVYATVLPFNNIASGFLSHKYYPGLIDVPTSMNSGAKASAVTYANSWMMIPFLISAILSPFLGGLVDKWGNRATAMLLSAATLVAVHTFFAIAPGVACPGLDSGVCCDSAGAEMGVDIAWYYHPAIGLVFLGLAYSVYAAAIWPAVVYVVKPNQVGTAYGLVTAIQNSGLAIAPLVVGALTKTTPASNPSDDAGGYRDAEWFFVCCGLVGVVIGLMLNMTKDGARLNRANPNEEIEEDIDGHVDSGGFWGC